ncbi:MAG: protoheme IX farnesyltransferase, partial [Gammaproteobacteria bacterium]
LFLWTPPHFWSLAIALHKDYKEANVPMLPVVIGDEKAAKIILANTILLVAVSIMPYFYEMGIVYLICAATGGAYFIYKSILLVLDTNKKTAMGCFFSSLLQLAMVILGSVLSRFI